MENLKMRAIILTLIAAATLFVTAGCEEEHEHHPYGGAYDGAYQGYGHDQWQGYPARPWHDDNWHR